MAKISIGIQFDRLDNVIYKIDAFQKDIMTHDNYKIAKEKMSKEIKTKNFVITQIISEIEDKFETECEKFCLGDNIIESFFDVYYEDTEEHEDFEPQLKKVLSFLSCLKNKYHNTELRPYVVRRTFNNDCFD